MPWNTDCQTKQRGQFIDQYLRRKTPFKTLCRHWRIAPKTGYKWVRRFRTQGRRGLRDRRRANHRLHNRPRPLWLNRIRRWRQRHPTWGAPKLHWALKRRFGRAGLPSEPAISRWLKAWGLTRRRRRRPAHKGPVLPRPRLTPARKANEVWTVDFKGCFRTGDGTRVEPLTVRDLASRYVLAIELMEHHSIEESRRVFARLFARYGLPQVIRSDNGSPFGAAGALGLTRLSACNRNASSIRPLAPICCHSPVKAKPVDSSTSLRS